MRIKKILSNGLFFLMIIFSVGVVYAINTVSEGFRVNSGAVATTIDLTAACADCKNVTRNAAGDIFVPTKTCAEWNAFKANATGVTVANCTGSPCGGVASVTDARDGQVYNTVEIGTQCWMTRNMNVGTRINLCSGGYTAGPCSNAGQTLQEQANNAVIEKYCYGDNVANCTTDGAIYQWAEAMQLNNSCNGMSCAGSIGSPHQGICPPGWHIPTDTEQYTLESYLKDGANSCRANRDTGANAPPDDCNAAGTKLRIGGTSGFQGVLNGYTTSAGGSNDSQFNNRGWVGGFWSTTENSSSVSEVWHRHLYGVGSVNPYDYNVFRHSGPKYFGDGVRCLKN